MQLLIRISDETSAYLYRYFKQMVDDAVQISKPISEYAEAYCAAYEQELKRIEGLDKESEFPRIKD